MIPEKWDKVYLYSSVLERPNHLETGEMYFYYVPKGVLKKKPVNVYEIPNKFNIDEEALKEMHLRIKENNFLKKAEKDEIKDLKAIIAKLAADWLIYWL